MGTTDRKEQIKKVRQDDIINAAEKVFFSKGIHNATMDEVAEAAEYSKRTIYAYFSSKEQIYDAIISRAYIIMYNLYREAFQREQPANGLEKVLLMGKTYLDFINTYPKHSEAMAYYDNREEDLASQDEYKRANYIESNKSSDLLIQCIREGIHDGSICGELDPVSAAFVLYGNIIGFGNIILRKEKYIAHTYQKDAPALIAEMYRLITRSLQP
jgi:TetR/AcrR family transcriptional regulator